MLPVVVEVVPNQSCRRARPPIKSTRQPADITPAPVGSEENVHAESVGEARNNNFFFNSDEIGLIRSSLLAWFAVNKRKMPWRGDKFGDVDDDTCILSPYGTLVAEMMCQQTRVSTVIPYWKAWMRRFPNLKSLSAASEDEVNSMWSGLGYYRRAQNLRKVSRCILQNYFNYSASCRSRLKLLASMMVSYPPYMKPSYRFQVLDHTPRVLCSRLRTRSPTLPLMVTLYVCCPDFELFLTLTVEPL
jgi:hypothetical protein